MDDQELNSTPKTTHMTVSVRDIDMPFFSMVTFMIKWAIASIPAAILLFIIGLIFWGLVSIFCGGLVAAISNM
jgi:hypothetical protein